MCAGDDAALIWIFPGEVYPCVFKLQEVAPGGGTVAADGPGGAELCSGLQQLPEQCEEGAHQHWSIPQGFSTTGRVCKADLPHHSCSSERREREENIIS